MDKNGQTRPGRGLVFATFSAALTAGGIVLSRLGKFPKIGFGALEQPAKALGATLLLLGVVIMLGTGISRVAHRAKNAENGELAVKMGVFLACIGALLLQGNAALMVLGVVMAGAGVARK